MPNKQDSRKSSTIENNNLDDRDDREPVPPLPSADLLNALTSAVIPCEFVPLNDVSRLLFSIVLDLRLSCLFGICIDGC
jgi:hypothetical protein